ncbi:MAG TPA: methylated-DNA--[protein]-cysteine S-methyltransferase [Firmicutes bacterium]|nr:methylated-DNA--[protein]-cysteine S-methyltransferase [Bacillota bacterium]
MQYIYKYQSPLGGVTMAADGLNLTGLWFDGQKYFARTLSEEFEEKPTPVFEETKRWLDLYFSGEIPDFQPPVSLNGTPFQLVVWEILRRIPYGKTTTYGVIAELAAAKLGRSSISARAIGGAVGRNPISIIIPCHRVVGADGSLTGYAGGIDKKIRLLEIEGVDIQKLSIPKRKRRCDDRSAGAAIG